jgi:hypothetical protein
MKRTHAFVILAAAVLTACGSDGLAPSSGSLRLEAAVSRSSLRFGDTTSLVFRLRNVGNDSLVLNFSNSCQILPYITTESSDEVVYPSSGAWGCYEALSSFTLAPGGERVTSVLVHGGASATYPAVPLLPGQYFAYARLEHRDFPLQSARVSVRVD